MNKIKFLTLCGFLLLTALQAFAQSPCVTVTKESGQPGEEVKVSIDLQQAEAVSALQMGIALNEHLHYVEGSAMLNTTRTADHTLSAGVKDGELRFMLYSLNMKALKAGDAPLLSFKLKLDKQPGVYALTPQNLLLTDVQGNTLSNVGSKAGSVTTLCALANYGNMTMDFGHVPLQNSYTQNLAVTNSGTTDLVITQLLFSVPTFASHTQLPLTITPGNSANITVNFTPQKRGKQQAKVRVVSNTVGVRNDIVLTADPYAVNELHVAENLSGDAETEIEVPLRVNNMDALCAFQFEFNLPEQVRYVEGSFKLSDRKQDHLLSVSCEKGHLIALAYSPTNQCFTGNDGVLASFKVKLIGPYGCDITATKALLTAMIDNQVTDVTSANYGAYVGINTPSISLDWGDIDMGRTPVTKQSEATLTIRNRGNATLRVERMVLRDGTDIKLDVETPFEIAPWNERNVKLTYHTLQKGEFSDILQIYSNDPSNRLAEKKVSGVRYEPNSVSMEALPTTQTEATLALMLDNYNVVSGIQFDMELPKGYAFSTVDDLVTQDRFSSFVANCQLLPSGLYRVFVYSLSNQVVERGMGTVLHIILHPEDATLITGNDCVKLSNIKVGGPDMVDVENYARDLNVNIPKPEIVSALNTVTISADDSAIYSLSGIKIANSLKAFPHLPAGVYICKGKRIIKR